MISRSFRAIDAGILVIALALTMGSCAVPSRTSRPESTSVPTSVNTDAETFSCPGVPDSSVDRMIDGETTFRGDISYYGDWIVRRFDCRAYESGRTQRSYAVLAVFGQIPRPGWRPLDKVGAYRGSKEEPFTVEGVEGEGIATVTDNGGGAVSFTCGEYYVVTSVHVGHDTVGDVRTNLINLAASMTPWVCQGEPIPGLPGNTPTTLTDLVTTSNSPTPTPPADATAGNSTRESTP